MNQSRLWTIGAVLVIIALLGGTWLIGVSPQLAAAREADNNLQTATAVNNGHRQTLAALQEESEHLDEVAEVLEELQQVVPENPEISSFISQIQKLAQRSGIIITALAFMEPIAYVPPAFGDATVTASAETVAANGLYVIPINLTAEGSPSALLNFSAALQRGMRFTLVHAVSVVPDDEGGGELTINGELFGLTGIAVAQPTDPNGPTP